MKRLIPVLVALVLPSIFALTGRADAQVLTFDELVAPDATIMSSVVCGNVSGFRFTSSHFHTLGGGITTDFTNSGTTHIGFEQTKGPITMDRVNGGTFSLQSLDAAEFYAPARLDHPDANFVVLTGYQAGGGVVTTQLPLDGIRDGIGGVNDFQHFVLPGTFTNLTSVVFTGLVTGGGDGGIALDSIQYTLGTAGTIGACVQTPAATTGPAVTMTSPVPGNVVGTIQLAADASSPAGMGSVQFRVDGIAVGAADATVPYAVTFDTTTVPDGQHTITAEARDLANALTTASVVVTVRNTPVVSSDPHYLSFDGVDDYVQVGDAPALSFGNGTTDSGMTIEAWINLASTARQQIIGKWGETANQEYKLQMVSGGSFRFELRDTSAGASAYVFTANGYSSLVGTWHHIAVTYDGRGGATAADGITMYIDGLPVTLVRVNNAAYVAMENGTDPVQIGREGPFWNQFHGGLDDIRLWNFARSASQIQGLFTSELVGNETGLVAYWKFNEGAGLLANDVTVNAQTGTLINGPVWFAGGPLGSTGPDTTPPVISNIVTSGITASSGVVSFTTSETATASVSYSATGACPCTTVNSTTTGTSHSVTLTSLAAATQYTFFVRATDLATNTATSPNFLLTTLAANVDTTPPTVSISAPAAGATVLGTVSLSANASDNTAVASVLFKVDGTQVGALDTVAPYSVSWNTTTIADGVHTITAEARDLANNLGTATITVFVQNSPVTSAPNYISLDGIDDYVAVADANSLSFGNGTSDTPLSLEMWFRPNAMGRAQLLGKWGETANQEYRLQVVSGASFRFDIRDNSANATTSVFTQNGYASLVGAWHHIAVTYDGRGGAAAANGITMYIDGVSVALVRQANAAYVAMENGTDPVQIGREGPFWNQFNGGLDDIRLWNVVRSGAQIQAAMANELTGAEAGLVAYWKFNEGTGTTAANAVSGGPAGILTSGPIWVAGGPLAPTGPDTTPPVISNIVTSNVTTAGFTVTFQTNEVTTARVSYSTTGACPCTDVLSATTGTNHTVTLTGLAANTLYTYFVRATDTSANASSSAALTQRTATPPPPTPSVTITSPSGTVLGTVTIAATVTSSIAIANVQFRVDGVNLGAADTTAPYSVSWNTTTVADGGHTITAIATDANGTTGSATVTVTVQNTPVTTTPHYVTLDGIDDYISVPDANPLSFGNGATDTPFTFEMWIRPNAMGRHQLIGKWGETSNQEYKFAITSGVFRLDIRDQSAGATVSVFTQNSYAALAGGWHHIAATYDGRGGATAADGMSIYVDGLPVALFRFNNAAYVAMENLADPIQIGREGPGWFQYTGAMDEIRLWNVARTQGQLQTSMSTELTGAEVGLVTYYKLNEASGITAANAVASGGAATLVNGPAFVAGAPIP